MTFHPDLNSLRIIRKLKETCTLETCLGRKDFDQNFHIQTATACRGACASDGLTEGSALLAGDLDITTSCSRPLRVTVCHCVSLLLDLIPWSCTTLASENNLRAILHTKSCLLQVGVEAPGIASAVQCLTSNCVHAMGDVLCCLDYLDCLIIFDSCMREAAQESLKPN